MNNAQIESIFRLVNREVWIVTAADGERRGGLAATWVSQASIDRDKPAVLIGIAPNHFTAELIDASRSFALHLLSLEAIELAWNFALGSGRDRDKLAGLAFTKGVTNSPVLRDALAFLECRVFARLVSGDRNYYWADVVASGQPGSGLPLTEQQLLAVATDEQKRQLAAGRDTDVQWQRPLQAEWRGQLPPDLSAQ